MAASTSTIISNTDIIMPATQVVSNEPANQKMPASEVGWLFVHEYYTFLNKDPSRLHCFYGEKSTLVHGTEGETVTPCQGEEEIKEKFQSLSLENCRVLVTNVDTQASINGGILIQVLGEMSNRNEVARKFAQTFFLVEQQNGQPNCYYVLNDIIRFLSDDDIEIYSGEDGAGTSTSPTGTLVEEPINVSSSQVEQVDPSNSAQNTSITESTQVTLRVMDANIPVPSSKENETHLRTEEVVDPVVDNDGMHVLSSALNTNVQPVQNRPSLSPTAQNYNGKTVNINKQESITTLTDSLSQDAANGQAFSMQSIQTYPSGSQPTPVISTNTTNIHQLPAVVSNQESITISTSIEPQSLQMLKASLSQGNYDQSKTVNVVTSTSPVEQDKNKRQSVVKTSSQVPSQSLTVNSSQDVGKDPSTPNNITSLTSETQLPVMQSKAGQPVNFPAASTTQSQAANTLHANNQSQKSMMDNNYIQLSSDKQKLSFAVQDNNNGQTTNVISIIGSQVSQPGLPGVGIHSQLPPVINNEVNRINNTTQTDQKDNISKNDMSDPQKLLDNNYASQSQVPKKTWASLAANESEKWSSNALAETKGVVASVPAKAIASQQQIRDNRDRRSEGQKNNGRCNSDTSLSIYVKGVTSSMSYEQLKAAFMAFGQVKHLDVVHTKSCAFVEYNNAESYRRALEVHTVDIGNETVNTEERRPARRNNGKTSRGRF